MIIIFNLCVLGIGMVTSIPIPGGKQLLAGLVNGGNSLINGISTFAGGFFTPSEFLGPAWDATTTIGPSAPASQKGSHCVFTYMKRENTCPKKCPAGYFCRRIHAGIDVHCNYSYCAKLGSFLPVHPDAEPIIPPAKFTFQDLKAVRHSDNEPL